MLRRIIVIGCAAALLSGCATRPKTYQPPDATKVDKSTKVLTEKVARARMTATKARDAVLRAGESSAKLVFLAKTVKDKLAILKTRVPPELVPFVENVQETALAQESEVEELRNQLTEAMNLHLKLQQQQKEEETARAQLQSDQNDYAGAAAGLAQDATNERNERIKVEKKLSQCRWTSWLWKIGIGLTILVVVTLIILKLMGKLVFTAAKIAS